MMQFLLCLEEAQLAEGGPAREEQSDPGPNATKEVDPNHAADQKEEPEFTKEVEALSVNPESPQESETGLDDIALQKAQDSEE